MGAVLIMVVIVILMLFDGKTKTWKRIIKLAMYTKLAMGAVLIFDDVDVDDKDLNSDEATSWSCCCTLLIILTRTLKDAMGLGMLKLMLIWYEMMWVMACPDFNNVPDDIWFQYYIMWVCLFVRDCLSFFSYILLPFILLLFEFLCVLLHISSTELQWTLNSSNAGR